MMEWVKRWKWVIAIAAALVVALAVWQFWPKSTAPVEEVVLDTPQPAPIVPRYGPETPKRWAWDEIPWRLVRFTPPAGYWVYYSEAKREYLVLPGTPLYRGADAPDEEALYTQAVAIFTEIHFDEGTFKDWKDTEYTMAEFLCARGTSEEDYTLCTPEASGDVYGTNPFGLPTHAFRYPKKAYQTKERIGNAPFTAVRLGPNGTFGLLFYAVNESRGLAPMRTIVQSLERTVVDAALLNQ